MLAVAMYNNEERTSISNVAAMRLGNGVQFVKEQNAGGCCPGLVKHIFDVSLVLTKPHGQQLWALQVVCGHSSGDKHER